MARRAASRRAQRGVALLGLLAVAVMVFAYVLTSRLNAASQFVGIDREHNAKVLSRAKQALIGYVAQQASLATENNPGRLPCPEAPGDFNTVNEGRAAGNCTLPAVGRLPWRTLGLDKLVDAASEPLWYVVSPGWALSNSTVPPLQTLINPDSPGQLNVDGVANDAVALIIAPGPAIRDGCTANVQTRPAAGPPDLRNYLECANATSPADLTFVTSAGGSTFNDQVLRVTTAHVMPALEAAIADRAQREIAPALRNAAFVLDSSSPRRWVSSSSNPPIYPYPAPFANPTTSNYRGTAGTYQGLMSFALSSGFVAYESPPPADAVETMGNGTIESQTCSWETANEVRVCEGEYKEPSSNPTLPMRIEMTATFTNVAMGFRTLDATRMQAWARDNNAALPWNPLAVSYRAEMNDGLTAGRPHGSVTVRFWADLPNVDAMSWGSRAHFLIRIERALIADHCLLRTSAGTCAGADTSWFARNQWQRNFYYAVAQNNTANVLPAVGGCTLASSNCLRFVDPALANDRNIRVLLVLAGRGLDTQTRPSLLPTDYLEYENANGDTVYEQRPMRSSRVANASINAPWNDRAVLVDWVATPTFPIAVLP